jgi:hypothetical protein
MARYFVKAFPERYQVKDVTADDRERVGTTHRRWVGDLLMIVNHLEWAINLEFRRNQL